MKKTVRMRVVGEVCLEYDLLHTFYYWTEILSLLIHKLKHRRRKTNN